MKYVMVAFTLLILMAGCISAGSTVPIQPQTRVAVDNKSAQLPPTTGSPTDNTTTQGAPIAPNQIIPLRGIPITLRYDYLNTEENLFTQVAIGHSYVSFSSPNRGIAETGIENQLVIQPKTAGAVASPNWGIAGTWVETPLIILPNKGSPVCIIKDTYGSGGYKYLPIGFASYREIVEEKVELTRPGWGLATTFHPDKRPFCIKNIRIAGVANCTTGILDDYDKKHIVINILNDKSEVIWSKYCAYRDLRNTESTLPSAVWRDIAVDNVTMGGDFTVDVLALSYTYDEPADAYEYFAIAYEKFIKCGDVPTNSFISKNGQKCDPYVGLYDQYGDPVCFNLCIRVDGIY
jgi:hypothetical protein